MSRQRSQVLRAQFLNLLEHEKDKTISLLCHLTLGANELSKEIKSLKFSQANRILRGCISRIKRIDSLVYQMFNAIPSDNQAKALRQVNRVYMLLQAEQRKLQIPKQAVYQQERKLFLNLKDWGRSLKHTQNTIKAWIQQFSNTVIHEYLQNQDEKTLENIEFVQLESPGVRKYKRQVNQGVKYEGLFAGVYYFFKNLIISKDQ